MRPVPPHIWDAYRRWAAAPTTSLPQVLLDAGAFYVPWPPTNPGTTVAYAPADKPDSLTPCTCGAAACGLPRHSPWCDRWEDPNG